jgi:hypothetical protein
MLLKGARSRVAELIDILHQKGLALRPPLFDGLRLTGGRILAEICMSEFTDTEGTRALKKRWDPQPLSFQQAMGIIALSLPAKCGASAMGRDGDQKQRSIPPRLTLP